MTKDDIISLPSPNLRKKSKPVKKITPEIVGVVEDMISATISWDESRDHEVGVALAAVQIDKLIRAIIVREDYEDKENQRFNVFINPEVVKLSGDIVEDYEGCLSVPNVYGKVPRYNKAKIKALDLDGKPFTVNASGFIARIFQHEIDHTEGCVFVDRIKELNNAFYRLNDEGKLEQLDYDKDVKDNTILWK